MPLVVDSDKRVNDFDLLKIQLFWVHKDPPITRMTQYELMDTVWGLQWLLLSDVYETQRPQAWFDQFEEALELARSRAFYLVQYESQKGVLNAGERYTERMFMEGESAPEFDYDSDEEKRVGKRPKLEDEVIAWLDPPHRVTDGFVKDMDNAFRAMDEALFVRWRIGDEAEDVPKIPEIRDLRHRVFQEFKEVKEQTALGYRREWMQTMLVHPSYIQTHVRWYPHDKRVNPRAVLVKKNEALAYVSIPTSVEDVITPPPTTEGRRGAVDMRMNTDAALFYVSGSVPGDDFVRKVFGGYHPSDAPLGKSGITRIPAMQKWLVTINEKKWWADSFAAAFLFYKRTTNDDELGKRVMG